MTEQATNTGLTDIQEFLLKNLCFLPDLPVSAKDLFVILDIERDSLPEFFDALHDLVPQWLEYDGSRYILPSAKAVRIVREFNPSIKDIYRMLSFFVKLYSEPENNQPGLLERYETYVLALLQNIKQSSVTFADLHAAYGRYLEHKRRYTDAMFMYQQAINMTYEIQPLSPLIAEYYNDLAFVSFSRKNTEKAYQYVEKALRQLKKIPQHLPEIEIKSYFLLGEILFRQKRYRNALTFYLRSLDILNQNNVRPSRLQTYIHTQIAESYRQLHDYDNALRHFRKSEQLISYLEEEDRKIFAEQIKMQKQIILSLQKLHRTMAHIIRFVTIAAIILGIIAAGAIIALFIFK